MFITDMDQTDMWSYFDTDNGEWGDQSQPFKISRMYKESF